VFQEPAYASIYPIGQGAILALGRVLTGYPWSGVLLSVALMSGGIAWMLYGYLPPGWAAVGGLIAALHFGLAPQWIGSYWGGAFCAFGGALMFGAFGRLREAPAKAMAITAGAGWAIVWLIRPYESVLLFVFMWMAVAVHAIRRRSQWRRWGVSLVLFASVQLFAGALTLLHNRAVTGSPVTLPYRLSQTVYGTPQSFFWQRPIESPGIHVAELESLYEWQRNQKEDLDEHPVRQFVRVVRDFWNFYVTTWYAVPVIGLLLLLGDGWVRVALSLIACALLVSAMYPFFLVHYVAAYTPVVVFLIVRGLIGLSAWSLRHVPVGRVLAVFIIVGGVLSPMPLAPLAAAVGVGSAGVEPPWLREQLSQRLSAIGGRHVVFVRYDPGHSFHDEWVFNAANVDDAEIVWCRALDGAANDDVIRYYRERTVWLAVVDDNGARVYRHAGDEADGVPAFTLGS
jgi:hypothetical protein